MGLFDDLNKAVKQAEEEIRKSGLEERMKDLEQGLTKAGKDMNQSLKSQPSGLAEATASSKATPAASTRHPHPGYAKIVAWVRRKYGHQISQLSDPWQKNLELGQISADACGGLSPKAKKGFLDYLKSQKYEQLLK